MSSGAPVRRDAWLSTVLDRRCGTLDGTASDGALAEELDRGGFDFVSAKVPPEAVGVLSRLADAGFRVVDTLVTFAGSPPTPAPGGGGAVRVRPARAEDREALERISGASLRMSRFHLDPALGPELGERVKRAWVANFFAGARGDAMGVAEIDGAPRGFLLAIHDRAAPALVVDLVATDPDWQGRGAGRALVAAACGAFPAAREGVAGTQLANTASHRFYQALGWRLARAVHVLHWHRTGSGA